MVPQRQILLVTLAISVVSLGPASRVARQRPALTIADTGPLTTEAPPFPLVEPFLAVSHVDERLMIASAMSTDAARTVLYASWDAGATWRRVNGPAGPSFEGGDPMVSFDVRGRGYLATIAPAFSIWRSDDARRWEGPVVAGDARRFDDREWLATVSRPGTREPVLYGAAKFTDRSREPPADVILTTRSIDGGRTFSAPRIIREPKGYLQLVSYLFVRADGTLLMPNITNYERLPDGRYRGSIWMRSSEDGITFSDPAYVAEYVSYGEAGGDRRWKGLGATPMTEVPARSGPGTLLMVWSAPIDDRLQIVVSRSVDGGRTWAAPVRVHRGGLLSNHSSPAIAVNRRGIVAVSWMDRRDDETDNCFRPYVAVSRDAGRTFEPEQRVSPAATCPGRGSRWMNGGETHGLVALGDGAFRIVWVSGDRGATHLHTARIGPGKD